VDYETPLRERYNRLVRGFAFDQASPLNAQVPGLNLHGGLLYAGSRRRPAFRHSIRTNCISAGIGLAWRSSGEVGIRGGYGLTYSRTERHRHRTPVSAGPTPLIASTDSQHYARGYAERSLPQGLYPNGLSDSPSARARVWPRISSVHHRSVLESPATALSSILFRIQRQCDGASCRCPPMSATSRNKLPVRCLSLHTSKILNSLPVADVPRTFNAQIAESLGGLLLIRYQTARPSRARRRSSPSAISTQVKHHRCPHWHQSYHSRR